MKWLTKSDYLKYMISPAYLWLAKHAKDRLPAFDEAGQAVVAAGNEVDVLARQLFGDGKLVKSLFSEGVQETQTLMRQGAGVIFQGSVLTQRRLFCASDVWVRNGGGAYDIYEVKSATRVKPEYIHDLAFQKLAIEEFGYRVGRLHVVHINNKYVRRGGVDPKQLLVSVDVTELVEKSMAATRKRIDSALAVVAAPHCPDYSLLNCSNFYAWLPIWRHLNQDLPAESIYNLCRLDAKLMKQLGAKGITRIADITADIILKPQQMAQLMTTRRGTPSIHKQRIADRLGELAYPIYFLDYETIFPSIPAYNGTRPYQQIPFQYSLHILDAPNGQLSQKEFLARGQADPVPELLAHLQADLGLVGSVVVWNKSFEMGVNDSMGRRFPAYRSYLKGVNKRVFDLMEIFSNQLYVDAGFHGSASIKKVLPVLIKDLSYDELVIKEGMTASNRWYQTAKGEIVGGDAELVYADLIKYCGLDTLAMVRIFEFLSRLAYVKPRVVTEQTALF